MSIALIDFPNTFVAGTRSLSFAEPCSLDEFDLVIWRPAAIANVYSTECVFEGKPVLEVRDSQRVFSHTRYWRAEFEEFLGRGGTLVMLAPAFTTMGLHTVQDIVPYDIIEALPGYREFEHAACSPSPVRCEVGEPFKQLFDAFGSQFVASSTFTAPHAQVVASIEGSQEPCAVYEYRHPGRVLVMPELRASITQTEITAVVDALDALSARLRLDARISGSIGARPIVTDKELALRAELAEASRQRRALQMKEAALLKEISDIAFFGQLEHGDRVGVINAALQVLHALGAYVQYGVGPTDTLMFEHLNHACILVVLQESDVASVEDLKRVLMEKSVPWANELNREVTPIAFVAGASASGIMAHVSGLREKLPTTPWLTGEALQLAYRDRDFDFLDAIWTQQAASVAPARN